MIGHKNHLLSFRERIASGKRTKQKILDFIGDYTRQYRTAPTLAQIALHLGWKEQSKSRVSVVVKELIAEDWLKRDGNSRHATLAHPYTKKRYFEEE